VALSLLALPGWRYDLRQNMTSATVHTLAWYVIAAVWLKRNWDQSQAQL